MPSKRPPMKLSAEETIYLHRWMRDEAQYQQGQGPAKRLQLAHRVRPADLAVLIAAAIPDPIEQLEAMSAPVSGGVEWPWSEASFEARLAEARQHLGLANQSG